MIYGLVASGVIYLLWMLVEKEHDGFFVFEFVEILLFIVFLAASAASLRRYRDKQLGGEITISQTLKLGLVASTAQALPLALFMYFFFSFYGEEYRYIYFEEGGKMAAHDIDLLGDLISNALFEAISTFLLVIVLGLLVSLVAAFFLGKKHTDVERVRK